MWYIYLSVFFFVICAKIILRFEMTQEAMKLLVGACVYDFSIVFKFSQFSSYLNGRYTIHHL